MASCTLIALRASSTTKVDSASSLILVDTRHCQRSIDFSSAHRSIFSARDLGEQDHELVSTQAAYHVRSPYSDYQSLGHRLHRLVPHPVAQRIIDLFEVI